MQLDSFGVRRYPGLDGFVSSKPSKRRLRVCIATEEIVGPIANGGIASTYFDLARLLVSLGHEVTVLYLKGRLCHNETIEHWIDYYADLGVTFVPLPEIEARYESAAPYWQERLYNAWQWLSQQPAFDVVHTSEWRGGAFYALLAKKQGLAFADTLFIVKTSSPHIWNRHYQMRFLENEQMLGVMYPEQMTVELSDMTVGGSAHLLSFMEHMGYRLPEGRTFVQPNVILFDRMNVEDKRPHYEIGDIVESDELVFFGRLEQRKGLEIFCDAIDFVVARGHKPAKITFLGKEGTRIPSYSDLKTKEFIALRAKKWQSDVVVHVDFNQHAAISYMLQSPCIAVMPSLIENSTMAVYEALVYRIPFISTNVGGTPELIERQYHERTLCAANPRDLSKYIQRVLSDGQVVAAPAFSNDRNLEVWRNFHSFLADSIEDGSVCGTLDKISAGGGASGKGAVRQECEVSSVSVCVVHAGDLEPLRTLIDSLYDLGLELCIGIAGYDGQTNNNLEQFVSDSQYKRIKVVLASECTLGEIYNRLAKEATGESLVFMRSDLHVPKAGFASVITTALSNSEASALAPMYEKVDVDGVRSHYLTMGGDMALGFVHRHALCGELVVVRANAFHDVGGFSEIHGMGGLSQNLAMRLLDSGYTLESLPVLLYEEYPSRSRWHLDEQTAQYFVSMPLFETFPLHLRKIFLSTHLKEKGQQRRKQQGRCKTKAGERDKNQLVNVELRDVSWRNNSLTSGDENKKVRIGLDPEKRIFGVFLRQTGKAWFAPRLIVESRGDETINVPLKRNENGFSVTWSLDKAVFRGQVNSQMFCPMTIHIIQDSEELEILRRYLKLEYLEGDGLGISSKAGIEYWSDGEPPQEKRQAAQHREHRKGKAVESDVNHPVSVQLCNIPWSISSPAEEGEENSGPRIRVGLDPEKRLFGVFLRQVGTDELVPRLTVESRGNETINIPLKADKKGFSATWSLEKAEFRGQGKSQMVCPLIIRIFQDVKEVESLQRYLKLDYSEDDGLSVWSKAGIEHWPDGEPPTEELLLRSRRLAVFQGK